MVRLKEQSDTRLYTSQYDILNNPIVVMCKHVYHDINGLFGSVQNHNIC